MNHLEYWIGKNVVDQIRSCDDLYLKSAVLVRLLFKDKKDKAGEPYIGHLYRVSSSMTTLCGQVAGLLHDVVEDIKDQYDSTKDVTFDDLVDIGIPTEIIDVLMLVTKEKNTCKLSKEEKLEKYNAEIDKIISSGNELALELKIADMSDNYNPERLQNCTLEQKDWFTRKYDGQLKKLIKAKKERE